MSQSEQLPIPFEFRPSLSGEDFLVAPSNADAIAWIERWRTWEAPALVVAGPAGAGKTHLAHVFQSLSGAHVIDAEDLKSGQLDTLIEAAPALVVEDVEARLAAGLAEPLLHLYNLAREGDVKILFTGEAAPARWDIALKDLSSRLKSLPVAEILAPDDALLGALIVKHFSDRQLKVDPGVVSYLMARMERSFAAARDVVAGLDALALTEKRAITVPLAKRVLDDLDAT